MAICAAKASSTSRDGRHMRQEAVVLGAATASSTARRCGDWRCEDVIHDKMVHGDRRCDSVGGGEWPAVALRRRRQVAAGDPYDDCDIKIRRVNVRANLDICISMFEFCM